MYIPVYDNHDFHLVDSFFSHLQFRASNPIIGGVKTSQNHITSSGVASLKLSDKNRYIYIYINY